MIGLETGIAMIDAETIDMMTGVGMTGMTGAMMTEAATMTEVAMKTEAAMKTGEVMIGVTTDVMIGVTTGMMIAMKIGEGQTAAAYCHGRIRCSRCAWAGRNGHIQCRRSSACIPAYGLALPSRQAAEQWKER